MEHRHLEYPVPDNWALIARTTYLRFNFEFVDGQNAKILVKFQNTDRILAFWAQLVF
jgi:hypothetical protein